MGAAQVCLALVTSTPSSPFFFLVPLILLPLTVASEASAGRPVAFGAKDTKVFACRSVSDF